MHLPSFKSLLALLATAVLLSSCGGKGSAAAPPVGGLTVESLEGGIQISWVAVPGVEYWLYGKVGSNICKNCGDNNPDNWKNGGFALGLKNAPISSPYYLTTLPNGTAVINGTTYAFIMDARVNGGAAGEATPAATTTPRLTGETWTTGSGLGNGNIKSVAYGTLTGNTTSTYLGLGTLGAKYQSADGLTWASITSSDTTNYLNATYAFSKFVGVGTSGAVVYTSDLQTWTPATFTTPVTSRLNAVSGNGSLLVAVGDQGTIITSGDGITWTAAATVPTSAALYGVSYSGVGLWVAVGASGTILTSPDGSVWTAVNSGTSANLNAVASLLNSSTYSIVAVANDGTFLQSSTGSTWSAAAPITVGTTTSLNAIVTSTGQSPSNQFMVVGNGGKAFTSLDGVTWTSRTTTTTQNLIGLIRGLHNQYLAWAADGTTVYSQ